MHFQLFIELNIIWEELRKIYVEEIRNEISNIID